jgi:hypothetical protein
MRMFVYDGGLKKHPKGSLRDPAGLGILEEQEVMDPMRYFLEHVFSRSAVCAALVVGSAGGCNDETTGEQDKGALDAVEVSALPESQPARSPDPVQAERATTKEAAPAVEPEKKQKGGLAGAPPHARPFKAPKKDEPRTPKADPATVEGSRVRAKTKAARDTERPEAVPAEAARDMERPEAVPAEAVRDMEHPEAVPAEAVRDTERPEAVPAVQKKYKDTKWTDSLDDSVELPKFTAARCRRECVDLGFEKGDCLSYRRSTILLMGGTEIRVCHGKGDKHCWCYKESDIRPKSHQERVAEDLEK